jgi:hypothetical protein
MMFFLCFTMFYGKDISEGSHADRVVLTMMLAVIGFTLFELLFEARARYLFCYSPIYVIFGMIGVRNAFHFAEGHIRIGKDGLH